MQYLYLISCHPYCKIGVANDVQSRLAQLSTGNPFPLEVLAVYGFESANAVEVALHQKFANACVRGEWFSLSAKDVDDIKEICQLLGGVTDKVPTVANEKEIEEAEALTEPTDGGKWDFAAMFADGWRMERANDGGRNNYWRWMKGSGSEKKMIYGGKIDDLPYALPDMRLVFRDGEQPLNPPNKPLAIKESVGNAPEKSVGTQS